MAHSARKRGTRWRICSEQQLAQRSQRLEQRNPHHLPLCTLGKRGPELPLDFEAQGCAKRACDIEYAAKKSCAAYMEQELQHDLQRLQLDAAGDTSETPHSSSCSALHVTPLVKDCTARYAVRAGAATGTDLFVPAQQRQ
eukprot:4512-Heterococcus_DN1.PRE.1